MTDPVDAAAAFFDEGFNCAQSVLAAFSELTGVDQIQLLKTASCFGAGIVRRGEVCGAVSGALMALGLARSVETPAAKETNYLLGEQFLQRFESKHGSLLCRELIGCDIRTPENRQAAKDKGVFTRLCPLFVRDAAAIVEAMLVEMP